MTPTHSVFSSFAKKFAAMITLALAAFVTISAAQTATTLHVFSGGTDGGAPQSSLAVDKNGNLFGTTWYGGDLSCGGGGRLRSSF